MNISVVIPAHNAGPWIEDCLRSVAWCDEIVVVDSFSTDRTLEICRRYTDRVFQRAWAGYREQKAFAHSKATKDWVILIDSDERVPPELRAEIERDGRARRDRLTVREGLPDAAVHERELTAALMHDARVLGRDSGAAQPNVAVRSAADGDRLLAETRDHLPPGC